MEFNELFDIKEDKNDLAEKAKETNYIKHLSMRLGILVVTVSLLFLVLSLVDKHSGVLGALYLSFYFFGIWLFYLIIETIILYILKKNSLGNANLTCIIVIIMISALIFKEFA